MILVLLAFVGFMQVAPPQLQPPAPLPQQTTEAPGAGTPSQGNPRTTTSGGGQVWTNESFGELLYGGSGVAAKHFAEDGFASLNQIWSLPDFLMNSRQPENTVDQPDAADLNDSMVRLIPGLLIAGLALTVAFNFASVIKGGEANPMAAIAAMTIVVFAAFAGVNNRTLQHYPIDLVNLLLGAISGAPIRDYAAGGAHVYEGVPLLWAAIVALAFLLLMFALTAVMFIEGAWCIVLGAQLGLLLMASPLPIFGSASLFLIRRWLGSLFSPFLVLTALKLMSVIIANLPTGTPDTGRQFLMLALGIVAWQAPGVMVGAISVSFPGLAQVYFAGRLLGNTWRPSDVALPRGGGGGGGGTTNVRQDPPRAQAPRNATPGRGHRQGGGIGATNRGLPMPRPA